MATQYPWRLCAGDIVASLQELASLQEAPSVDAMPRKIHHLLQLGYSSVILQEGIHMLLNALGHC